MRVLIVVSLITVGFGLALAGGESAYARTPTPTSTSIPTATSTPGPALTPSAERSARFYGTAYVNARFSTAEITARIGDVVCGETKPVALKFTGPRYDMTVVSAQVKPGCGYEGATIVFFVGGQQAPQTAVWHTSTEQPLTLIIGPPFAAFESSIIFDEPMREDYNLVAYVNSNACTGSSLWTQLVPYYRFFVTVYSQAQQPGCGYEGAEVSFKLLDAQGNVIAVSPEKRTWHVEDGVPRIRPTGDPEYFLKLVPVGRTGITLGNVGDGSSRQSRTTLWTEMSLVLAIMGLGGIAMGVELRRRAMLPH